MSVKLIFLTFH